MASRAAQKRYREKNRAEINRKSRAKARYYNLRRYKLTLEEYRRLFALQSGLCAICGQPESIPGWMLSVDHEHGGTRVRGLLCNMCNRGLGFFGDDLLRLRAAVKYLEDNNESR